MRRTSVIHQDTVFQSRAGFSSAPSLPLDSATFSIRLTRSPSRINVSDLCAGVITHYHSKSVIFITSPPPKPGPLAVGLVAIQIKQSKNLPEPEPRREPSAFAKKIAEAGAKLYRFSGGPDTAR